MKYNYQKLRKKKGAVPEGRAPVDGWRFVVTASEPTNFDGLTRSCGKLVFVDDGYSQFLGRKMVLDHGLLPLTLGLRLATTAETAELAHADVERGAVNCPTLVLMFALGGARVTDRPLAGAMIDHRSTAETAELRSGNDRLLTVYLDFAEKDQTAGSEVAGFADAINLALVLLGAPAKNELHAVNVDGTDGGHVALRLAPLLLTAAGVKMNGAELVVVAISSSPAVGQLVFGLEHCDDGRDGLFFVCLDRNQRQGRQLLVTDDLHFSVLSVVKCADSEPP